MASLLRQFSESPANSVPCVNTQALRDFLQKHGYFFYSETDTEVIPKLCDYIMKTHHRKPPFSELIMEAKPPPPQCPPTGGGARLG